MKALLLLVVTLAACSNSTGLGGGVDPTVLVTNQTATDTLYFTWRDGQGIAGSAMVLPGATGCEKFVARADSAYFQAQATHWFGGTPSTSTYTAPWFDPSLRSGWTMTITWHSGSPSFLVTDVSPSAPC